jgi:hypothetical protein
MGFYDLRDALAQPSCPVCRLKADAVDRSIDILLWENVNDSGARQNIRQARGFCHQHAWQLIRGGASSGSVIIMRDVLQNVLRILENARLEPVVPVPFFRRTQPAAATAELVAELSPQVPCPVCAQAETAESALITTLVEGLPGENGLLQAYQASEGLCLPHLRQALSTARDPAVSAALVETQCAIWEKLEGHLSEIIRKLDYRFREEPRGEETGAAARAVAALSGWRDRSK